MCARQPFALPGAWGQSPMFSPRADFAVERLRRSGVLAALRPPWPGYKGGPKTSPRALSHSLCERHVPPGAGVESAGNRGERSAAAPEFRCCWRLVDERDLDGLVAERESRAPPPRTRKTLDTREIGRWSIRAAADLGLPRPVLDSALPSVCKPPPCPPCSYQRIAHPNLELAFDWVARRRNRHRCTISAAVVIAELKGGKRRSACPVRFKTDGRD
jgi:hypothetical protein